TRLVPKIARQKSRAAECRNRRAAVSGAAPPATSRLPRKGANGLTWSSLRTVQTDCALTRSRCKRNRIGRGTTNATKRKRIRILRSAAVQGSAGVSSEGPAAGTARWTRLGRLAVAVTGLLMLFRSRGDARAPQLFRIVFAEQHVPLLAAFEDLFLLR